MWSSICVPTVGDGAAQNRVEWQQHQPMASTRSRRWHAAATPRTRRGTEEWRALSLFSPAPSRSAAGTGRAVRVCTDTSAGVQTSTKQHSTARHGTGWRQRHIRSACDNERTATTPNECSRARPALHPLAPRAVQRKQAASCDDSCGVSGSTAAEASHSVADAHVHSASPAWSASPRQRCSQRSTHASSRHCSAPASCCRMLCGTGAAAVF